MAAALRKDSSLTAELASGHYGEFTALVDGQRQAAPATVSPQVWIRLDLWHGAGRSAANKPPAGSREGWPSGDTSCATGGSPGVALMSGKLRLAKGSLATLLRFASAAKEFLELAGKVPTAFPLAPEG